MATELGERYSYMTFHVELYLVKDFPTCLRTLEAMARIVCGNNENLGTNREAFVSALGLSDHFGKMLRLHTGYAHKYRHASKAEEQREAPLPQEVEAFVYTTGLFLRLAIERLRAQHSSTEGNAAEP